MRRVAGILLVIGLLAGPGWAEAAGPGDAGKDGKGTEVVLDGLRSQAPAAWKEEKPVSQMRFLQFRLPRVKDDPYDAELVVFRGIGGSAKENIRRWKEFFLPPPGKTLDEVAKVTEIKVGDLTVPYLDIQGTYKYNPMPFNQNAKVERRPDYRMLAAVFQTKKNVYHIRLVGPAATVEHYRPGFESWLKAFK